MMAAKVVGPDGHCLCMEDHPQCVKGVSTRHYLRIRE